MFEIGPIGCIPSIARATTHNGQCIEETNQLVSYFNQRLGPMLNNLQNTLIGSSFVLGRVNGLGYDAITNPTRYGKINPLHFLIPKFDRFLIGPVSSAPVS